MIRVAYIDYANSLSHGWQDQVRAGTVSVVGHYPNQAPVDEAAMAEAIDRIGALPDDQIRGIVTRVDHTFAPSPKRSIMESALIVRKTKLRAALKAVYPKLP